MNNPMRPISPLLFFLIPALMGIGVQTLSMGTQRYAMGSQRFSVLPAGKGEKEEKITPAEKKETGTKSEPEQIQSDNDENTSNIAGTIDQNKDAEEVNTNEDLAVEKPVVEKTVGAKPTLLPAGWRNKK